MYSYTWDAETGGILLNTSPLTFSKEPRPVYYKELDILGFDRIWNYEKNDAYPYMWAEANSYYYRGRLVAKTKGGALYTAPEIIPIEDPEPDGAPLRFVDVPAMVEKNRDVLEKLARDTIKRVFNTYCTYKNKVDIFHVSYSGGKDSEVTLDLVQNALPHTDFVVIFGDTGMEFPDTYEAVKKTEQICIEKGIQFYRSTSHLRAPDTWTVFGPPSKTIRWCCSVHKTAPQLLKLREIVGKSDVREMAYVGVRGDESVRRSGYDYISQGTKHKGQYSCNPILEWNSAEVYLYIFMNSLPLNETYKKGNTRAGCLVCPMSADKSDYMRYACYPDEVSAFMDTVTATSIKNLPTEAENKRYIECGGWKVRNNGRDIFCMEEKYIESSCENGTSIVVLNPNTSWREWLKTIGDIVETDVGYEVSKGKGKAYFTVTPVESGFSVTIRQPESASDFAVIKGLKEVFRKAAYCVLCKECVADCQRGCLTMDDGVLRVSEDCISCSNCHKPDTGCLLYKSLVLPKGTGKMNTNSLDCYADHAPKIEWIEAFIKQGNAFFDYNELGSVMLSMFKRFLRDADLISNNATTSFATLIQRVGLQNPQSWALMLVNLSYSPEIGWYIKNMPPFITYSRAELIEKLQAAGTKERGSKSITGAYKRILALPFGSELGLGQVESKNKELYYTRFSWNDPDPIVVLYSLYKFAEACGGYYQFTLTRLMDHEIDSDGISPTEIFGLDRDTMVKLLNGLSINYPDYVNASFTLDLDNITLNSDKTSADVLNMI